MGKLLLKNVYVDNQKRDILIVNSIISRIAENITADDDCEVLQGNGMVAMPGLVNMHTHTSMTLLRGVKEDMPLNEWLPAIWKIEANLNDEFIYWGTKLAALEMIKTGTTSFLDMYFRIPSAQKAVKEMGLRGFYSYVLLNNFDPTIGAKQRTECEEQYYQSLEWDSTRKFAVAIHADYTVDEETIRFGKKFADKHGMLVHIHSSETEGEVQRCIDKHGMTPVAYMDSLGVLDENTVAAHCLWLSDDDIDILARRKVNVVHNINSNLKISSGYKFRYEELRDAGVNVCLGTDGASTNNNMDMLESMKIMALLQKGWRGKPDALPLGELIDIATLNGAKALKINAGAIREGSLADIILIDRNMSYFVPNVNFAANLVYAAGSRCVDTVICNGKILMRGGKVDGEDEIIQNASKMALKLINL